MKIPKKYKHMIKSIELDAAAHTTSFTDPGYWVELKDGWTLDGSTSFGEDTLQQVWNTMLEVEAA